MTNEERDKAIKDIAEKVSDIHGDIKVIKDKTNEHHRTLYGNGRLGLVERHNAVEAAQRACPAKQEFLVSNRIAKRANMIQIVSAIVAVGALLVAVAAILAS